MLSLGNGGSLPAVLLVFLCSAQAQNLNSCPHRSVVVTVRDQQGKLVDGLEPSAFRAVLRGQPVRILSSKAQTSPPRVVLLMDVSGSVNFSNHNLQMARFVVENFLAASPTPYVALVLFSDHVIDTIGFNRAPSEILQRLKRLTDGKGRTAVMDSLVYAIGLSPPLESGDAIYLISDGGDNRSKLRRRDVERLLLAKGIRLFPVILSSGYASTSVAEAVSEITHLSEVTGGGIVYAWRDQFANGSDQLSAQIKAANELTKSFYKLELELPPRFEAEHRWELEVVNENGKRRRDVEVRYPKELVPCPESTPNTTGGQ
jgi:hypothetical protein